MAPVDPPLASSPARCYTREFFELVQGMLAWPGLPSLVDEVPRLHQLLKQNWERAPDVFERFPLPMGREPRRFYMLRPRDPQRAGAAAAAAAAGR